MAQSVKFHGKYKGVIVSRTEVKNLSDKLELGRGKLIDLLVKNMCYIGEACIKIARETGDYNDITGNLRSSIGTPGKNLISNNDISLRLSTAQRWQRRISCRYCFRTSPST